MTVKYLTGESSIRERKLISGDGSSGDPDVFEFGDSGAHQRIGEITDAPVASPSTAGSLIAALRGFWNAIGLSSDSASPVGTIHGKLRRIAETIGASGDTASRSGSLMAMVRFLAESTYVEQQTASAVTIGTSLTTVITFDCRGRRILGVCLRNTGANPLSGLQIQARYHSSLSIWNPIAINGTDFTTENARQSNNPSAPILDSGTSTGVAFNSNLPATSDGWLRINCSGIESIRIQAQSATSTTMLAHGVME